MAQHGFSHDRMCIIVPARRKSLHRRGWYEINLKAGAVLYFSCQKYGDCFCVVGFKINSFDFDV